MKKIYLFLLVAFSFISAATFAQVPFTAGNLVVLRVGDGTAALTSASTATFLDEYTTTGTLVQSVPLSTNTDATSLTSAGSSTSEGQITRSADKVYILVPGYGIKPGVAAIASTSSDTPRIVGIVSKNASIDLTTRLSDAFIKNNIRGVASTNGTDLWLCGNSSTSGGVRYTTKGATTTTQLSTAPTNLRGVNIYNGQLYITSASSPYTGVSSVGVGTPTTSGQTATLLNGFPATGGANSFAFNTAGDVLYVADDRATASGGGVQKWTLSAGTWTLAYTHTTGAVRGLAVDWTTTNPTIYATTSTAIVSLIDAGSAVTTPTSIVTAATNLGFRGLVFSPELSTSPVKLNGFAAQKLNNNTVSVYWTTEQEFNNKSFVIQRSGDGYVWKDLTSINAAGTSATTKNYEIIDPLPLNGFNYYRLKQINNDGSYSISAIKKIFYSSSNKVMITPNPAKDFINVFVSKTDNANTVVKISDVNGKIVRSATSPLSTINISTIGLAKGIYFVKVADGKNVTTQRVTVL